MLKGKMLIEMTDVHTGQTETVLEENMVTDALTEIFRPLGIAKDPAKMLNTLAPYYANLLGGLLLFDTPIEERKDNLFATATAHLVGCGVYGAQNGTTGTLRGGYNREESEFNTSERYMKYVYDFTTSQAKGTINCICLTHKNGGYSSYGGKDVVFSNIMLGEQIDDGTLRYANPSYTGANTSDKFVATFTVGVTELLFLIDSDADLVYYLRIDSNRKVTIIRRRAWLKNVSVFDNPYTTKPLVDAVSVDLTTALLSTTYLNYYYDIADNCLYLITAAAQPAPANSNLQVTKIELSNHTITQYNMVNTAGVALNTTGTRFAIVHEGYLYIKEQNTPYGIYKFELGNAANVTKIKAIGVTNTSGVFCFGINGRIYIEGYSGGDGYWLYVINTDTNEIMKCEANHIFCNTGNYPCYTPVLNHPITWYASFGNWNNITPGFINMCSYLATINNLAEPVTKTADKTMKVTYIIQEQ